MCMYSSLVQWARVDDQAIVFFQINNRQIIGIGTVGTEGLYSPPSNTSEQYLWRDHLDWQVLLLTSVLQSSTTSYTHANGHLSVYIFPKLLLHGKLKAILTPKVMISSL